MSYTNAKMISGFENTTNPTHISTRKRDEIIHEEVIYKAKVRGTSNAPIVLGVVGGGLGGGLGLPASLCSGMCAAVAEGMTEAEAGGMIEFYLYGTAIISIALIILTCFSKKAPVAALGNRFWSALGSQKEHRHIGCTEHKHCFRHSW